MGDFPTLRWMMKQRRREVEIDGQRNLGLHPEAGRGEAEAWREPVSSRDGGEIRP